MSKDELFIVKRDDGWAVTRANAQRASSLHSTQADAIGKAKETARKNPAGGEVRWQGRNSRWINSDTIAPANDPFPPKG